MKKRVIGSGVAAAVIATTMALTPVVNDNVVSTNNTVVEDTIESKEKVEKAEIIEEGKTDTSEKTKSETQKEHMEAILPSYDDYTTEIGYTLDGDNHTKRLIIDVPNELSIDIAVLYVNDVEVDTALIPTQASFVSIPIVFEKLENLEIKLYKMGVEVGSARFIDGILKTNAKAVI